MSQSHACHLNKDAALLEQQDHRRISEGNLKGPAASISMDFAHVKQELKSYFSLSIHGTFALTAFRFPLCFNSCKTWSMAAGRPSTAGQT